MLLINLHRTQTPFAIIKSYELIGINYSVIYQDRYLKCHDLTRCEVRWICDNNYLFKLKLNNECGEVWEYQNFSQKINCISPALRYI